MSASVFFDWLTASQAGKDGHLVRRRAWTDRWLQYYNGLWWFRVGTDTPSVVKAADFGRNEFLAEDWTNLPPECVTTALAASGQTCPKPYNPNDPAEDGVTDGGGDGGNDGGDNTDGSGSSTVEGEGSSSGGNPGTGPTTGVPGVPPSGGVGSSGGGSFGVGGGGGGGGGRTPRPPRSSTQWPSVSLTMDDWTDPHPCYPRDGTGTQMAKFGGTVSLGTTADTATGKPAAGGYFVSVRHGNKVLWHGILWPGESKDYEIHEVGPGFPGQSAFTFEARAHLPHSNSGDITAKASKTMQPWCEYAFQFWCATEGGGCHEGVGWVTVRSPGGTVLYEGCPSQGSLGMGNTSITAGTSVTIQYSNNNGPCPGGHACDNAVFRIELASGSAHVVLGTANLNNGDDWGDRGPFTFTVTQALLDSLAAP